MMVDIVRATEEINSPWLFAITNKLNVTSLFSTFQYAPKRLSDCKLVQ